MINSRKGLIGSPHGLLYVDVKLKKCLRTYNKNYVHFDDTLTSTPLPLEGRFRGRSNLEIVRTGRGFGGPSFRKTKTTPKKCATYLNRSAQSMGLLLCFIRSHHTIALSFIVRGKSASFLVRRIAPQEGNFQKKKKQTPPRTTIPTSSTV